MTRGLCFFQVSGLSQRFTTTEVSGFSSRPRPTHGLFYIACSNAVFFGQDRVTQVFHRGNLIYIPKGIRYQIRFDNHDANELSDLQVTFQLKTPSGIDCFFCDDITLLLEDTPEEIVQYFVEISDISINNIYPTFPISRAFFSMMELLADLLRFADLKSGKTSRLLPALRYLDRNTTRPTSVVELAQMCHMSETAFRREFKKETGLSPVEFKSKLRIKKAKELVYTDPNVSVASLVEALGFCDPSYFYKEFHAVCGEGFREFRLRTRAQLAFRYEQLTY